MAMYLRRVISSRNSLMFLRNYHNNTIIQTHNNSHYLLYKSEIHKIQILPPFASLNVHRRGFAKGKKSRDDSDGGIAQVAPGIGPSVKASASSQMDAAVIALSRELAKLRTGRASPGMLDHIIVETNSKQPLSRIAAVSVMDPKTLSINPYDPETLKPIEKAIVSSPLGLNPKVDGERLIASIPSLTKEHMQAMCKVVSKSCEDVKQSIRRARQKALDTIKKSGSSFSKDEIKRLEKEIDELTKKFVKSAEDICKAKEKEITQG